MAEAACASRVAAISASIVATASDQPSVLRSWRSLFSDLNMYAVGPLGTTRVPPTTKGSPPMFTRCQYRW